MTLDHILDTVFRAGVFRAMHGVSPQAGAAIAIGVVVLAVATHRFRR